MANFWLAKTKAEIKAIPYTQCSEGARLWCIDTQTSFRFFEYRNFPEFSYIPNAIIRPTDLPNNASGIWQNEGTIYARRTDGSSSYVLYYNPPFPPATPTQRVILDYVPSDFPDEHYLVEWIAFYPPYRPSFPEFINEEYSNDKSWKINRMKTTLTNRSPASDGISAGDGALIYKKDENRLFFNSNKLMNDNNHFGISPSDYTWEEMQFTETEVV